ncbi:hypothetical protein VAEU17_4290384 [Vibrio aestuarianus]|nr:hypothetical protein VAEU17_4290384 [Vibrio aestuarianus]
MEVRWGSKQCYGRTLELLVLANDFLIRKVPTVTYFKFF